MHPAISRHRAAIGAICERFSVRRLEVFGSAARAADFNPALSDADFLIEFESEAATGLKEFFGAKAALEELLGRPVDLVQPGAVQNPYVRRSIDESRESIYAA